MDSDGLPRWVAALVIALALVLLVALARGEPDRAPRGASLPVTSHQSI